MVRFDVRALCKPSADTFLGLPASNLFYKRPWLDRHQSRKQHHRKSAYAFTSRFIRFGYTPSLTGGRQKLQCNAPTALKSEIPPDEKRSFMRITSVP